jgi:hypothetical protein
MSKSPGDPVRAREAAARVLASGLVQTAGAGELQEPVPVHTPDGAEIAGWFVGMALGDRLTGFLQLQADLSFRRYSSFQHHPRLADWLDRSQILDRARSQAASGEQLTDPFLTYDQSPDRLAWAVKATDSKGQESTIYVAGEYAYRAGPSGGFGGL